MNLRTRVGLAGGLVVFGTMLLASAVLGPVVAATIHRQLDAGLVATAATGPAAIKQIKADGPTASSDEKLRLSGPVKFGSTLLQVVQPPVIAGGSDGFVPIDARDVAVAEARAAPYFRDVNYQGVSYRVYTALLVGADPSLIRVARPRDEEAATMRRVWSLLAALTALGTAGAGVIARLVAGRVLSPVRTLTDAVERVAVTQDLSVRIDAASPDELGRLAAAFTAMMANLDGSIRAQQQLVADASHELRTPLTSLTTNLELLAEGHGTDDPQAPALVREARTQARGLALLVNDLVDLGRYSQTEPHTEDVRLDLLVGDVVTRATIRAPELVFEADLLACLVHADPDALQRAVGNLLDNAIKWSSSSGRIQIRAGPVTGPGDDSGAGRTAEVTVSDEGPGIPDVDLPFVFDRFYRAPSARSLPGSGLGLAIVRRIAESSGGSVSAEPLPKGVRLRLLLPLSSAVPDGP